MPTNPKNHTEAHLRYAIWILIAVLVALGVFLVFQYRQVRHAETVSAHAYWLAAFLRQHRAPLAAGDAGTIQAWMTFDLVNRLFSLPPAYLQNVLSIQNVRYPRLTITGQASAAGTASATYLEKVRAAVANYFAAASSTAARAAPNPAK
jgi:hypothetical protein